MGEQEAGQVHGGERLALIGQGSLDVQEAPPVGAHQGIGTGGQQVAGLVLHHGLADVGMAHREGAAKTAALALVGLFMQGDPLELAQ